MTCKDCIHCLICYRSQNMTDEQYKKFNPLSEKEGCAYFKDKSRVVELPCNVNDVLYVTEYDSDSDECYIEKVKVNSIEIDEYGISVYTKNINNSYETYYASDFNESVFLTKEDAKKAIDEE